VTQRIELDDLGAAIAARGAAAYLVSIGDERPHVVSVAVEVLADASDDGAPRLRVGAGRTTPRNVAVRPAVTLLWPASDEHPDLSLLVDGTATVDDPPDTITIEVTGAILHTTTPSGPDRRC
jgi:hypothetical protein